MSLLSDLSIEELYQILDCRKLKKVKHVFDEYDDKFPDFNRDSIFNDIRQQYQPFMTDFPIMHNLFSLIWNVPSLPIVALLGILQASTLGATAVIALTCGMAGLAVGLGIYYFYRAFKDYKQSYKKDQKIFDFLFIKLACSQLILQKHNALVRERECLADNDNNIQQGIIAPKPFIKPFVFKNQDKNRKIQEAVLSGAMNSSMLVGTYMLTVAAVCAGVGFVAAASAILGPVGIAVSCAIALCIGIFCAYTHYKSAMATARRDAFYDFNENQLSKLTEKCNRIRHLYEPERTIKRSNSDIDLPNFRRRHPQTSPTLQRISFLSKRPIVTHNVKEHSPTHNTQNYNHH